MTLTDWFCTLVVSLETTVRSNSSGDASAGTRILTCHPGSVPRLTIAYIAETISHGHDFRSLAIDARQSRADCDARTSAMNSRLPGVSSATIAGVGNRGRQRARSL